MIPNSGPVGTSAMISITSTSFPLDGQYQVRWSSTATFDKEEDIIILAEGDNPRMSYELTVSFVIPEAKYGVNYVQLIRYGADDVLNFQFSVKPVITVEPQTACPGGTVTISGMGFPGKDQGEITFDGSTPKIPFTTNEIGSFNAVFTVPETIAGSHKFVANSAKLFADSTSANLAIGPFVTLTPENPEVGSEVTISGSGFAGNSPLTVEYDAHALPNVSNTSDSGSFSHKFTVTESTQKEHKIVVTDHAGNTAKYGLLTENTAPPKPTILAPKEKDQVFGFMGDEVVTFSWTPVSDPSGITYTVEVGDNLEFFPIKPGLKKTDLTDTATSMKIPPGTYFWRVKAVDGAGNEGEWQVSPYFFKVGVISFWFLVAGGAAVILILIFLIRAFFRRVREYYD